MPGTISIERLAASDFMPDKELFFQDHAGLHELYDHLAFRSNLLLVGPKGAGKTLSLAAYAAKKKVPVITCDCSEDVRRSNLLGSFVLRGDETPFVLGPVTTAFEVANEAGCCILVFEELGCLSPQMQKILNPLTDYRCRLEVPECQRVFKLKPQAKLWVAGTMNSASYAGVHALNEDLKSRFRMLPITYPKLTVEKALIRSAIKGSSAISEGELNGILVLAHETRQKELDYALSTRDVLQLVEDTGLVGLKSALRLCLGKFEGEDRVTIVTRVKSIFDVDLSEF